MRLFAISAVFVILSTPVSADDARKGDPKQDPDPIADKLEKAKEDYIQSMGKAKDILIKAFEKRYDEIKANKNLKLEAQIKQLEALDAEKKAFEENDTLPTSLIMKVGLSEYRTNLKKAETLVKAAFDDAAKAYRNKGDIKAAAATLSECKDFLTLSPAKETEKPVSTPFVIVTRNSGMVIAPTDNDEGTKVLTAEYKKGAEIQLWKSIPVEDGWVQIEHVSSGLALAISRNGKTNGSEIIIAKKDKTNDCQLWKNTPVKGMKDVVRFVSKASDRVIGVDARSNRSGMRMLLWDDMNHSAEWFSLIRPK